MGPVVAPTGTVAVMEVADATEKLALTPLKLTLVTRERFTPEMVTVVPTSPLAGEKPVMLGGTALTAAPAFTIPDPQFVVVQVPPAGKAFAVFRIICRTCAGVRLGLSENIKDATPLTCGAAALLPDT